MINIITQFFKVNRDKEDPEYDKLTERQNEYNFCLKKNLKYEYVEKIHLLLENDEDINELIRENIDLNDSKLKIVNLNKQMLYSDAFIYANKFLKDKIVVLIHSDIYLEYGFHKISNLDRKIYPLARTSNVDGKSTGRGIRVYKIKNKEDDYCATFDGFCFRPPIKKNIIENSNHKLNIWGGENKIIYLFKKNKYHVFTPNELKIIHWHKTDLRPWIKKENFWITIDNKLIKHESQEYYDKLKNNKDVVGGGIPIELGTSKMVNHF